MRDKLINILQKPTPRAMGGAYIKAADEILAALRCDTCKHWTRYALEIGECSINTVHLEGIDTERDFFCALWEAKA